MTDIGLSATRFSFQSFRSHFMKIFRHFRHLFLAILLLTSGAANAAVLQFTLTGAYAASWQLDTAQPPFDPFEGFWVTYIDLSGSFPGASTPVVDITFYSPALDGGFEIYDYNAGIALVETVGPQLYTGSETDPVFTLGTFALTAIDGPGSYLLTIAEVGATAVPEPATGALLFGGLAVMYGARRRRQR
jgi:hypothetical protein